jgi:CrcB protein
LIESVVLYSFSEWRLTTIPPFRKVDMPKYLLIAIGGALGSIARYWVTNAVNARLVAPFHAGTLAVNLAACLAIGLLIPSAKRRDGAGSPWRFLIAVGFIGAFSTFSTFEWEMFSTARSGAFLLAGIYAGVSLLFGLFAVWSGTKIADALSSGSNSGFTPFSAPSSPSDDISTLKK